MKLKLFTIPNCVEAEKIRKFLIESNLTFEEAVVNNDAYQELDGIAKYLKYSKESFLIVRHSHSIHGIHGFNEFALNQLLEHIKKYKPGIE